MLRRINLSAALICLVCFFLPWEQISCGGAQDSVTGLDLARHEHFLLWLVPLAMLAVLVFGLLRRRRAKPFALSLISLISGGIAAYLMNDERLRVNDAAGIISARLTGWFWLGFIAAAAMVISGIGMLLRRSNSSSTEVAAGT
jgi:hypothetical protein